MSNTVEPDEVVLIARDLIRINTSNFGGGKSKGEREAAEYIEAWLTEHGLNSTLFESAPRRTNLAARIPGRNKTKPALVVHGHLDVVPAVKDEWIHDPFAGVIEDGMLHGRGAVDMKNVNAMFLSALGRILSDGTAPERDIILMFFADEEDGCRLGSDWMVKNHPELFTNATEAVSEVGGYSITVAGRRAYLLQTGEKAMLWLRLTATGPQSHGSLKVAQNAITDLAEAVLAVSRNVWPIQLTTTTRELLTKLAALAGISFDSDNPDVLAQRTGVAAKFLEATFRTTSNPTVLNAGYKHNVIPNRAEALIDVRTLPGEEDETFANIQRIVGEHIEVEIVHRDIGLEAPTDGDFVLAAKRALAKHDPGAPVFPYLMSGGTDNKALSQLGITGYGFAPLLLPADFDFPQMFHGVNERVPISSLLFGRDVLQDLFLEY